MAAKTQTKPNECVHKRWLLLQIEIVQSDSELDGH